MEFVFGFFLVWEGFVGILFGIIEFFMFSVCLFESVSRLGVWYGGIFFGVLCGFFSLSFFLW